MPVNEPELTRRRLLELGLAVPVSFAVAACSEGDSGASDGSETATRSDTATADGTARVPPTPACDDGDDATPEQTEGPFFTPDSPERASLLEPGIDGTRLVVTGSVVLTDCTPVPRALLDFWHADADGQYDGEGYRLRGHQFAGRNGRYRLETIVPGLYSPRTRHIHVKAQAPHQPVLTTQLYFPGEPANATDGIFDRALVMKVRKAQETWAARFDFVLAPA